MKKQHLLSIIILAIIVSIGALYIRQRENASYRSAESQIGKKLLGDFDVNKVTQVNIIQGTQKVTLIKNDNSWVVVQKKSYPADFEKLRQTVQKLWELKVIQPVNVPTSQLYRLDLLPPESPTNAATRIDLLDSQGHTLRSVLLGKKYIRKSTGNEIEGWPEGRYVMVTGKPETTTLVSETFSEVDPKPENWISKDWFRVERIKTVVVEWPDAPGESWAVSRNSETDEFQLQDPKDEEILDHTKVSALRSLFSYPSFVDVITEPLPELDNRSPLVVQIETFDNFKYTFRVFQSTTNTNQYYLRLDVSAQIPERRSATENETPEERKSRDEEYAKKVEVLKRKFDKEKSYVGWTYLVQQWVVQPILKKRSELLQTTLPTSTNTTEDSSSLSDPLFPAQSSISNSQPLPLLPQTTQTNLTQTAPK